MRVSYTLFLTFLLIVLIGANGYSQCNTAPCVTPVPQVNAMDACILPYPQALDCYYGATTPDAPVSFPPFWCTAIHNNHWFAFTADATTADFNISVYGCASGNGIQAAVLSTADCINFQFVSPCLGNIPTQTTQTLTATGLIPGQVYYLCIDGSGGALCDYSINGSVPTITGPTTGICIPSAPQAVYSTTAVSSWSIIPPSAGTIVGNPIAAQITVNWQQPGSAQVCAQNASCPDAPNFCLDVIVGEDSHTDEHVELCQGKTITCAGQTFSSQGTFLVNLPSYLDCDSIIHCYVHLIPTVTTTENVLLCQGYSVECAGQQFGNPGTYPVTLTAYQGCDSIVKCKVTLIPTYISPFYFVTMCGPAEYTLCTNSYSSSGLYSETCTSSLGCDSIVNVNLAILEPMAVIAPPAILDCGANSTITLSATGSPPNTAIGGSTLYNWSGPGIIGFNNQPTVTINQPGVYCLILRHGRSGIYCADTACVTVSAVSAVPQLPQISGSPSPCADSTLIYTATAVGNPSPTSYTWTTPNNIAYTSLAPNSIQITWNGAVTTGGQLCVTANNSCGVSSPACIPIAVQPALIPIQPLGPASVCANGGNYTYTVAPLQNNVNYSWTIPPGAILSGSGDTVTINFLNSVSGQVCVSNQNICGTGAPVCQNVQVSPVPTATLSGGGDICAGESINLTYTLGGNGPFDVVWSDGTQNFTLNDIANGHILTLTPTLNTTYTLVSVSDNTTPIACVEPASTSVTARVWPLFSATPTIQICQGGSVLLGGAMQNTSGVYIDSLTTIHGCDSVITTTLIVHPIDTLVLALTTCNPAAAGTTTVVLSQTNGCDSIVVTTTTLLPSDTTLIFDTDCDVNNVGLFTQNLSNVYGCDSTVTTTITFSLSDTTLLSGSSCDTAATGVFTQNLVTQNGCDSLIITTVSLLPSDTTMLFDMSCNPASVGVFNQNLNNQYGCDSTVITTVIFFHTDTTLLSATSCDPAAAGIFAQTIVTSGGCDSVIVTTVILLPSDTTLLFDSSCNPANVGVFTQNLNNQYGCDSTVILTVSFFLNDTTLLTGTSCDPAATGIFSQTLITPDGCDSIVITTVSLLPSNTTMLFGMSCNPAQVGVFTQILNNQYGCDSTVILTVSFFHTDTTLLSATTCDQAATGVFSQTIVTTGGCDSVILTTVTLLPSSQVAIQSTTCNPTAAGVFIYDLFNQYGCDSTVTETVLLLPSDTTYLAFNTCNPAQAGTTIDVQSNQWGCDSTIISVTSLLPAANCGAMANLTGSNIPCAANTGFLTLTPTVGIPPFDFTVLLGGTPVANGSVAALGLPQQVSGLAAGNYTVVVSSANGFSTTAQATIVQLVPPALSASVISNYNGYDVSCIGDTDGSARATANGGAPPYQYVWSNGGTTQQINNIGAGTFSVTVTDTNGCNNTATTTLQEPTPLIFGFTVNDLDCFGQHDGAIFVNAIGGVPPYRYALDNAPPQSSNGFTGLNPGSFTVNTWDANDCQKTEIILVNAAIHLNVELGNNQIIELGSSATLQAIVNVPFDSILSVAWTPPFDTTDCTTCLTQVVAPFVSTTYSVLVEALNGCTDEDKVTIIVDRRRHLYIPNVFSPNGDGENDFFGILAKAGTVRSIKSLQVYDRWGEAVYVNTNFAPNNPAIGWDGKLNGQPMAPAVFVWVVEVEFIDGVVEVFSGDVSLLR